MLYSYSFSPFRPVKTAACMLLLLPKLPAAPPCAALCSLQSPMASVLMLRHPRIEHTLGNTDSRFWKISIFVFFTFFSIAPALAPWWTHKPRETTVVLQPFTLQVPRPPCATQSRRCDACAVQPERMQTPLPPCLPHTPRALAFDLHPSNEHFPFPPCFVQSPRALTLEVHPVKVQTPLPPCLTQSPCFRLAALVVHPGRRQVPLPPCLKHNPSATAEVEHPCSTQTPLAPCFQQRPRTCAFVVQPGAVHCPLFPPCFQHRPRVLAFVVHPRAEHKVLPPCFLHLAFGTETITVHDAAMHVSGVPAAAAAIAADFRGTCGVIGRFTSRLFDPLRLPALLRAPP